MNRLLRKEDGNFIILTVFMLILLAMIFFMVYDAIRRYQLEAEIQKLADGAALYTAAFMPSIKTPELRNGQVHDLSVADAKELENYALSKAEEYMNRNVLYNRASMYYGGSFEVDYVDPKLTVVGTGGGLHRVTYDVKVTVITPWASAILSRGESIRATAIARSEMDGLSYATTLLGDDESDWDPLDIFDCALFAEDWISIGNIDNTFLGGDVHSNTNKVNFNNGPGSTCTVVGDVSAAGDIDMTNSDFTVTGDLLSEGLVKLQNDNNTITGDVWAHDGITVHNVDSVNITGDLYADDTIRLTNIAAGGVTGNVTTEADINSDGSGTVSGTESDYTAVAPIDAPTLTMPVLTPPVDEDDPNWNGPITIIESGDLQINGSFGGPGTGGTVYVKNGQIHINAGAAIEGDWSFICEDQIHLNNNADITLGGDDNEVVLMTNDQIHINNAGNVTLSATLYSYGPGGGIHINNADNVTVNGALLSGDQLNLNNLNSLTVNPKDVTDALPPTLKTRVSTQPPSIPPATVTLIN